MRYEIAAKRAPNRLMLIDFISKSEGESTKAESTTVRAKSPNKPHDI